MKKICDKNGIIRMRYDPTEATPNGDSIIMHWHYYDSSGTPLDQFGNPTAPGAPNSHIYK